MARRYGPVRHLGVWAADRPEQQSFYLSGRWVPICGRKHVNDGWSFVEPNDDRPLCKVCIWHFEQMIEIVGAA